MLDVEKVETLDCVTPLAHNPLPQNRITDGVVARQAHFIWARRLERLELVLEIETGRC